MQCSAMLSAQAPPPVYCPAARRMRRGAATQAGRVRRPRAVAAAATPSPEQRSYQGLTYSSEPPPYDESASIERELMSVSLGLNELEPAEVEAAALSGVRAEFQWLPRGTEGGLVRESRGVPTFDLLALDYHTLRSEVTLNPEQEAELERLSSRYFVDRVYDRAQILERVRRIYEMEPQDPRNVNQEAQDLLFTFQQMNENHFQITNMVAARAEERETELGKLIASGPPQVVPDSSTLAIADVALYLEFERELLLQGVKEQAQMRENAVEATRKREQHRYNSLVAFAETALREGLSMPQLAALGIDVLHLQAAVRRIGGAGATLPFALEEYRSLVAQQGGDA